MLTSPPMRIAFAAIVLSALVCSPAHAFTAANTRTPMTVSSEDAHFIALRGRIDPGSIAVVGAALDRQRANHPVVLVDSPGGLIEPASAIGRLIRARGLKVAVGRIDAGRPTDDAECASACVLLLAAGVTRTVGPDASVGLHRFVDWTTYSKTWDVYRIVRREVAGRSVVVGRELVSRRVLSSREVKKEVPATAYSVVRSYLAEMGVSPDIVRLMLATPVGDLHWMTSAELATTRIATDRARL